MKLVTPLIVFWALQLYGSVAVPSVVRQTDATKRNSPTPVSRTVLKIPRGGGGTRMAWLTASASLLIAEEMILEFSSEVVPALGLSQTEINRYLMRQICHCLVCVVSVPLFRLLFSPATVDPAWVAILLIMSKESGAAGLVPRTADDAIGSGPTIFITIADKLLQCANISVYGILFFYGVSAFVGGKLFHYGFPEKTLVLSYVMASAVSGVASIVGLVSASRARKTASRN